MSREPGNPFEIIPKPSADSAEVIGRLLPGSEKLWRRASRRERVRPEPDLLMGAVFGGDQDIIDIEKGRKMQPGEFRLTTDVSFPMDEKLFDKSERGFKFDSVNEDLKIALTGELSAFDLTLQDLSDVGIASIEMQNALLGPIEGGLSIGKLISTQELVDEYRARHPEGGRAPHITMILMQLAARGYKPANLLQSLSYARDHWSPVEESELTDDQVVLKSSAKKVLCLGALRPTEKRSNSDPVGGADFLWCLELYSTRDKFTSELQRSLTLDVFDALTADKYEYVLAVRGLPVRKAAKT